MGSEYRPLSPEGSCSIESSECFICRESELQAKNPLRNFCDCKNLLAHHVCLSTWIQRGCGSEDRLRCIICKAKYQLQRRSAWRSVSFQWQTWLMVLLAAVLLGLVPYVVHRMMTAFTNPPPPSSFKVAAASFGLLTEILLIKSLLSFLSSRYQKAVQSSFTVRPRSLQVDTGSRGHRDQSQDSSSFSTSTTSSASLAEGHVAPAAPPGQTNALRNGCLGVF